MVVVFPSSSAHTHTHRERERERERERDRDRDRDRESETERKGGGCKRGVKLNSNFINCWIHLDQAVDSVAPGKVPVVNMQLHKKSAAL